MSAPVVAFVVALCVAFVLTPRVRAMARRRGLVAAPVADRWHRAPTALLGGVAIAGGVLAGGGAGALAGAPPAVRDAGLAAAALLMFLTGLADDRRRLRFPAKVALQLAAAALVVATAGAFAVTPWGGVNVLLTVTWVVGITNALNLLDNMDGIAAGVAGLAALAVALLLARAGAWGPAAGAAALAGGSLGFLRGNAPPASIFMGDAGALFLGVALAGFLAGGPAPAAGDGMGRLVVAATLLAVPLLDTTMVFVTRVASGRRFYVGGRDHVTHRLARLGLTDRRVAQVVWSVAALAGAVAVWLAGRPTVMQVGGGAAFLTGLALATAWLVRATGGVAHPPARAVPPARPAVEAPGAAPGRP